jgi:hypothetical protein
MPTALRAFLLLRTQAAEWSVTVHRDLESLLAEWKSNGDHELSVGIVHIGFDRPLAREFDEMAKNFIGRVLVSATAKYSLPSQFAASEDEVGFVGTLPIYLAIKGWGYEIEDELVSSTVSKISRKNLALEGWVLEVSSKNPELVAALSSAGIYNEFSYLRHEEELSQELRHALGIFRFDQLIGSEQEDCCAIARAAPPWLSKRSFATIPLTVRSWNVFERIKVISVRDLGEYTLRELLKVQFFGRKSCEDVNPDFSQSLGASGLRI